MASSQPPLILDTMVLTWLIDPRSPRPDWEAFVVGRTLVLTFVTVGEILHAARRWSLAKQTDLENRLRTYPIIPGTIGVARRFADLRARYFDRVGDDDLWVAACALTQPNPVELATADSDFTRIAADFPLVIAAP